MGIEVWRLRHDESGSNSGDETADAAQAAGIDAVTGAAPAAMEQRVPDARLPEPAPPALDSEMDLDWPALQEAVSHCRSCDLHQTRTQTVFGVGDLDASLMVIENPERLGLAQLHQLRGRIGRGGDRSHCVLMYHAPLSQGARERLGVLRDSSDGFEIARRDLELRGPGEVLGTRQTGEMQLRIADVVRDEVLLPDVQRAAELILRDYPERALPLVRRWLGERTRYARV